MTSLRPVRSRHSIWSKSYWQVKIENNSALLQPFPVIGTHLSISIAVLILLGLFQAAVQAAPEEEPDEAFEFSDFPLQQPLEHPAWFKQSFLDLREDLREADAADKAGIIVYFGQQRCAYCKLLMTVNFGQPETAIYTRQNFDVIPIDIWGVDEVTDINGTLLTEREFALREKTNFTPSLIFYDKSGAEALRLRGYYPPYKFRAALEYVADAHFRKESFSSFLERGSGALAFEPGELNDQDFFTPPPYALDRSRFPAERPLALFFEQGDCHACNVLHAQPLSEPEIIDLFEQFENVQLDMHADTPVITPGGERLSAKEWARKLGLFYTPSLIFFDHHGKEIIRVDSVVQFYRLRNVLRYVLSGGYLTQPDYQLWRVNGAP
ncbi:MAG: thioredoxin fold domain-containing protein [Gammaproteobacteria bacterium]|nr:thioredoxin fold domain-containing protein [Gammaproteobacteria bacterium]MCP5415982.1 thioredoxin fold domain-containing protein [Chromatiaceae bacterium]